MIITKVNAAGASITATNMLETMTENHVQLRSASDVFNAVIDGTGRYNAFR